MVNSEDLDKLIEYIRSSKRIVFFGGAGVSTESGIPDFRSKDGLYNQKDIQFEEYSPEYLLSHECLYHNPKVFFLFIVRKWIPEIYSQILHTKCLPSWRTAVSCQRLLHRTLMVCIKKPVVRMYWKSMGQLKGVIVPSPC